MKKVMVRSGIPPSVSIATVRRVKRKIELKWSHAQKKKSWLKVDFKVYPESKLPRDVAC